MTTPAVAGDPDPLAAIRGPRVDPAPLGVGLRALLATTLPLHVPIALAAGGPYWYPPTPVTWAMPFYGGDFLHDDPGEPPRAFG